MTRATLAISALLLGPWLFRTIALMESPRGAQWNDLRGFTADAATALLALGLLWLLSRWARWLGALLVGVLTLGYYANYETITGLGTIASPLDLKFLFDPTFFGGSALALVHPVICILAVAGATVLAWFGLRDGSAANALLSIAGAGLLFGVLTFWPTASNLAPWRQVNAIQYNADWLAFRSIEDDRGNFGNPETAMRELLPELGADLDAPLQFPLAGKGRNILLVILEGVTGGYLPTAAKHHARPPFYPLARLDQTFSKNVSFPTFVNHQRRTNRGLFALLCGEYPRLVVGTPKMSLAAIKPWRVCLPEILRDEGYRTVYLQAAPLAFMQKDRFMPSIGFDETLGHDSFDKPYLRTFWGVDDRTLFEEALRRIDQLEEGQPPWFLTMLNVGTHHPYTVPPSFRTSYNDPFRRAFNYMDRHFDRFLKELEDRGVLENTLVLVTSDESRGDLRTTDDGTASGLTENWGFLIAILPEKRQLLAHEVFAQSDIPLSVLDYLGLGALGSDFSGRSVFRRYDRGRPVFFGNVNYRTIGGMKADGSIVQCKKEGRDCAQYHPRRGRLFSNRISRMPDDPIFTETVREIARRSLPPQEDEAMVMPLLFDPVFKVRYRGFQMVQGISQLALETDEWYEVDIEAEVVGLGAVDIYHKLTISRTRPVIEVRARIEPGQTFRLRYSIASDTPIPTQTLRTHARMADGMPAELVFRKRRFELFRGGERPPAGAVVLEANLEPPPENEDALSIAIVPIKEYYPFLRRREARGIDHLEANEEMP